MSLRQSRDDSLARAAVSYAAVAVGSVENVQAEVFLHQAEQAAGRSGHYAELCQRLAHDPAVGAILESPPRWDAPLRLLGGLHYLVLTGEASWDDIEHALT